MLQTFSKKIVRLPKEPFLSRDREGEEGISFIALRLPRYVTEEEGGYHGGSKSRVEV